PLDAGGAARTGRGAAGGARADHVRQRHPRPGRDARGRGRLPAEGRHAGTADQGHPRARGRRDAHLAVDHRPAAARGPPPPASRGARPAGDPAAHRARTGSAPARRGGLQQPRDRAGAVPGGGHGQEPRLDRAAQARGARPYERGAARPARPRPRLTRQPGRWGFQPGPIRMAGVNLLPPLPFQTWSSPFLLMAAMSALPSLFTSPTDMRVLAYSVQPGPVSMAGANLLLPLPFQMWSLPALTAARSAM